MIYIYNGQVVGKIQQHPDGFKLDLLLRGGGVVEQVSSDQDYLIKRILVSWPIAKLKD